MKRSVSFLLVLVFCMSLIGCREKVQDYEKEGSVLITGVIPDTCFDFTVDMPED